jgi:hypothetical protein
MLPPLPQRFLIGMWYVRQLNQRSSECSDSSPLPSTLQVPPKVDYRLADWDLVA